MFCTRFSSTLLFSMLRLGMELRSIAYRGHVRHSSPCCHDAVRAKTYAPGARKVYLVELRERSNAAGHLDRNILSRPNFTKLFCLKKGGLQLKCAL